MNAWPTALFVLLWSSGAIFSRWGLDHASPFVLLALRFGVALAFLSLLGWHERAWLPAPGTRAQVAGTGLLLVGGYSCTYFLALDQGLTPGALATILGVQPIATLLLQERRAPALRWLGLALALIGLVLVVLDSLLRARVSVAGVAWALAALGCITLGTMAGQYSIRKKPFPEALSTLEAGYHLLSQWEGEPERFAPLMNLFTLLNRQWHDFAQGRRA